MSKKIRVAWEDLQPGDLIHVKGSTNVYQFIRFTENKCQAEVGTSGVCAGWGGRKVRDNEGKVRYWFETGPTAMLVVSLLGFAYATRPAPKKKPRPSIVEPKLPGEYWARLKMGSETTWGQIIKRHAPRSDSWLFGHDDKAPYQTSWYRTLAGLHPWMTWEELLEANKRTPILELLSAEEYYTRKAKGQS